MTKKVHARLNWGRWIADCPNCNGAEIVKPGMVFVCASCHPGIAAVAFRVRSNGLSYRVPDDVARNETREIASKKGEVYEIVWPKDKAKIDELTFKRPTPNANWEPHETVKDLIAENISHGVR